MQALQTNGNNYTFYDYKFSKTTVRYVVMSDTKAVFMLLLPCGMEDKVNDTFEKVIVNDGGYPNHLDWYAGSLVHLHLAHHTTPMPDATFKLSETTKQNVRPTKDSKRSFNKKQLVALVVAVLAIIAGGGYLWHIKHSEGDKPDFTFLKILRDTTNTDVKKDTINDFILNPSDQIVPNDTIKSELIDDISDTIKTNI